MAEFNQTMWAPWRWEYICSVNEKSDTGCFLCRHAADAGADATNYVLWRSANCLTMLNLFPYSSGHLLVAPVVHVATLYELPDGVAEEMIRAVRDAQRLLAAALTPHGFNVGINFGRCAGAGVPDHLHMHIVPRWDGDTNFMSVCGDTRVLPQTLDSLYEQLRESAVQLGLPGLRG